MDQFSVFQAYSRSWVKLPEYGRLYHQHIVNLVQPTINPILTSIKVLNMQLYDITNSVVKHEEARGLFDGIVGLIYIDQIENRCKNFVHSLNILNPWIKSGVNVEDAGHIIIPVGFSLLLFTPHKLLVTLFTLSINQFEFLSSRTCQIRYHYWTALSCEERYLGMSP